MTEEAVRIHLENARTHLLDAMQELRHASTLYLVDGKTHKSNPIVQLIHELDQVTLRTQRQFPNPVVQAESGPVIVTTAEVQVVEVRED